MYLCKDYLREKLQTKEAQLNGTLQETDFLTDIGLKNLPIFMVFAVAVSFSTFWGIGLSFDKYFYKNKRHIVRIFYFVNLIEQCHLIFPDQLSFERKIVEFCNYFLTHQIIHMFSLRNKKKLIQMEACHLFWITQVLKYQSLLESK